MARPKISFNNIVNTDGNFLMKGNTATNISLSIVTNTIGKSEVEILLDNPSCSFFGGHQEIVKEVETSQVDEMTELEFDVIIQSDLSEEIFFLLHRLPFRNGVPVGCDTGFPCRQLRQTHI